MPKITLLMVDDHEIVRAGLRMLLQAQPDMQIVGEAEDGRAAIAKAKELAAQRRADGHFTAGHRRL